MLLKLYSKMFTTLELFFFFLPGIALPPKGTLDMQVLFMPQVMRLQKTMVLIQMRKASGKKWFVDNFMELHPEVKR